MAVLSIFCYNYAIKEGMWSSIVSLAIPANTKAVGWLPAKLAKKLNRWLFN